MTQKEQSTDIEESLDMLDCLHQAPQYQPYLTLLFKTTSTNMEKYLFWPVNKCLKYTWAINQICKGRLLCHKAQSFVFGHKSTFVREFLIGTPWPLLPSILKTVSKANRGNFISSKLHNEGCVQKKELLVP